MSPNRIVELIKPIVIILMCVFLVGLIYGWITDNDYDDDFTVTITYDCDRVLGNQRDYPVEVLQECLELRDEIKTRNHN